MGNYTGNNNEIRLRVQVSEERSTYPTSQPRFPSVRTSICIGGTTAQLVTLLIPQAFLKAYMKSADLIPV